MSKLEREIDRLAGEETVDVAWPLSEEMLRQYTWSRLKAEVDRHQFRVPLDLRKVVGAPPAFLELLYDLNDYAAGVGKHVVISHALPEMRLALDPTARPKGVRRQASGETSGDVAWRALQQNFAREAKSTRKLAAKHTTATSLLTSAAGANPTKLPRKSVKSPLLKKRWFQLVLAIACGTAVVGIAEWVYLIYLDNGQAKPVNIQWRTFE